MSYFKTQNKSECCGCSACIGICPKKCIQFIEDKEGFSYPHINKDECIECGLCEKVCPFIHHKKLKNPEVKVCYALKHQSDEIIEKSASGGAFSNIVEAFSDDSTKIIGAELCNDFSVKHTVAHNMNEAKKFSKSKYVESDINGTYKKAKEFLEAGNKVIFSGTGCQIAGLRGYLIKEYDNLFTVDLVCHGVPSKKVFRKYLEYLQEHYDGKILEYTFRTKVSYLGVVDPLSITAKFDNDKEMSLIAKYDYYMRGFLKSLFNRPSCYNCPFANSNRVADITLADFWGFNMVDEKFDSRKGISLVICNTSKGKKIFNKISRAEVYKTKLDYAKVENHNLVHPTPMNDARTMFFEDLKNYDFDECIDRYTRPVNKIKENLSIGLKSLVIKLGILGKIKKVLKLLKK